MKKGKIHFVDSIFHEIMKYVLISCFYRLMFFLLSSESQTGDPRRFTSRMGTGEAGSPKPRVTETIGRIVYGLVIFGGFLFSTWAGPLCMAVFIAFVSLAGLHEIWIFAKNEILASLKQKLSRENDEKSANVINVLVGKINTEIIVLNCVCAFYHTLRTIHSLFPMKMILPVIQTYCGSSFFYYLVIYPLKFYSFITCVFYLAYLLIAIKNVKQSAENDVIFSHHLAALAVQHLMAILTIVGAINVTFSLFFGNFWTFLVMTGVAVNDACAYFIGRHFGQRPLSAKLSPKKTLEGYFGAGVCTVLALLSFTKMALSFQGNNDSYLKQFSTDNGISIGISDPSLILTHAFVISAFISTFSPLIGLHFSAIKRCFKKKDFASTLGPHGGIIDRFDCSMVSNIFSYCYLSFITSIYS